MHRLIFRRSMAAFTKVKRDGSRVEVQIRPSYAHKPKAVANLNQGLSELLINPRQTSPARQNGDGLKSRSGSDNNNGGAWELDDSGDTIHRHVHLSQQTQIPHVLQQISDAVHELQHDPHTHVDGANLTISCTTHVPPGLSMKDVKLAKKIDAILEGVVGTNTESQSHMSPEQKERAEQHNMAAIQKAKEECACGRD